MNGVSSHHSPFRGCREEKKRERGGRGSCLVWFSRYFASKMERRKKQDEDRQEQPRSSHADSDSVVSKNSEEVQEMLQNLELRQDEVQEVRQDEAQEVQLRQLQRDETKKGGENSPLVHQQQQQQLRRVEMDEQQQQQQQQQQLRNEASASGDLDIDCIVNEYAEGCFMVLAGGSGQLMEMARSQFSQKMGERESNEEETVEEKEARLRREETVSQLFRNELLEAKKKEEERKKKEERRRRRREKREEEKLSMSPLTDVERRRFLHVQEEVHAYTRRQYQELNDIEQEILRMMRLHQSSGRAPFLDMATTIRNSLTKEGRTTDRQPYLLTLPPRNEEERRENFERCQEQIDDFISFSNFIRSQQNQFFLE